MAKKVLAMYGSCKMEVHNFTARYYYLDENDIWVEVDYELF